jgi:hypothetical protein
MDAQRLARDTAIAYGQDVLKATEAAMSIPLTRSFGPNEYLAVGSFIASLAQVAVALYQMQKSPDELVQLLEKQAPVQSGINPEQCKEIAKQIVVLLITQASETSANAGKS